MRNRYTLISLFAILVLLLDQFTKMLIQATMLKNSERVIIDGFFNLVYVENRGAAFGILNRSDIEWQFWLFLAAAVVAAGVIIVLARQAEPKEYMFFIALGLILGGAAGNLIDRVLYRAVVDFLDFYIENWHWPAFNVADIAICCGAALALLASWKRHGRQH